MSSDDSQGLRSPSAAHTGAPHPVDEAERASALDRTKLLDSGPEHIFESLVQLAQSICDVPIALVSLVDRDRQWFKAKVGLDVPETHRNLAFCAHAILTPKKLTIVEDAREDPRFCNSPLVVGPPHIRFYAGAPIIDASGQPLGTVCVIDRRKRTLDLEQMAALSALAQQASVVIGLRTLSASNRVELQAMSRRVSDAFAGITDSGAALLRNQRLQTIGQLTSGLAHDFNNLLQALGVNFQILQRKSDDAEAVALWATKGLETVRRGAGLVANLLAMSKTQASTESAIDIAKQVRASADMFERVLPSSIQLSLALDATAVVLCDPAQLDSAVLNLVINARDALAGRGHITIRTRLQSVSGHAEMRDGEYLVLQIEDDGCGMSADLVEKVFEPFFTTKGEKGTGLGLAQVLGFALKSKGYAAIHSTLDVGTTVSLYLKTSDRESRPVEPVARIDAPVDGPKQKTKVLLISSNADNRDALAALFDVAGFLVVPVASGYAAVPLIEHYTPDVVVSDWTLPGLGGKVLLDVLRAMLPRAPIHFLTGELEQSEFFASDERVFRLQKPVEGNAVLDSVRQSLAG